MSFNKETIQNVAKLARLRLADEKQDRFMNDVNDILNWVEQLKEVDVNGVEPLISVSSQQSAMRQDVVSVGHLQNEVTMNAAQSVHGFYVVPKMVE